MRDRVSDGSGSVDKSEQNSFSPGSTEVHIKYHNYY